MNPLNAWATRWGIPPQAMADLAASLTHTMAASGDLHSEAGVQSAYRLQAVASGLRLWRNNVGVLVDTTGRPVRYGLANDSPAVNARLKSADLIGVNVDTGQFVSRECKAPGWTYNPNNEREQAQMAWTTLINSCGGDAKFVTV